MITRPPSSRASKDRGGELNRRQVLALLLLVTAAAVWSWQKLRSDRRPLIVILGPTGVGKSAAAIELALRFEGEIINADSMQVYRGFDIGTAKPSPDDRRRVPHHLLDIVEPTVQFTAADFAARPAAADPPHPRAGAAALCRGGDGTLSQVSAGGPLPGSRTRPGSVRRGWRRRPRTSGLDSLEKELERVDPVYAGPSAPATRCAWSGPSRSTP